MNLPILPSVLAQKGPQTVPSLALGRTIRGSGLATPCQAVYCADLAHSTSGRSTLVRERELKIERARSEESTVRSALWRSLSPLSPLTVLEYPPSSLLHQHQDLSSGRPFRSLASSQQPGRLSSSPLTPLAPRASDHTQEAPLPLQIIVMLLFSSYTESPSNPSIPCCYP
jgi:hypothetical protein